MRALGFCSPVAGLCDGSETHRAKAQECVTVRRQVPLSGEVLVGNTLEYVIDGNEKNWSPVFEVLTWFTAQNPTELGEGMIRGVNIIAPKGEPFPEHLHRYHRVDTARCVEER